MNSIEINRTNGNIPKSLPGEDHVSGFLLYRGSASAFPGFSASKPFQAISSIERAEKLEITANHATWEVRALHYQLSEIFRINPNITLYVGVSFAEAFDKKYEVEKLQHFAGGRIRQMAVWAPSLAFDDTQLTDLLGQASTLEGKGNPLSILYAPFVASVTALPKVSAQSGRSNVSVVIGQSGDKFAATLFAEAKVNNTIKKSLTSIGLVLGLVSRAKVHESISWVRKFPTGISIPAFSDGTLLNAVDKAVIEGLDNQGRYIFFTTYSGINGTYINDSHTMDEVISDYSMIENVRTMDKAVRNIRTYLLPELGSSLYLDAETGKLQTHTVNYFQTIAGKALEDMEKAGEISGYSVEIDPEQDVLSTSELKIVIKKVGVGVLRHIKINIGYAKRLESAETEEESETKPEA